MSSRETRTRGLADDSTLLGTGGHGSLPTLPANEVPAWIGRFVVTGELGRGGMGVVVSAYDPELDRKVAIKLVGRHREREEARQRMQREAQALAKLAHPNVISIYDVGEVEQGLYIAMEHVDGSDLADWLVQPRPLAQVLARFVDAGRGLAAAHAQGLVHRDFKPANVLLGRDGRVRVVDFGLARRDAPSLESLSLAESPEVWSDEVTRVGVVMGTPAYMAPEQSRGEEVDARSDLFSFCVALWEGTTGVRPFPHDDATARRTAIEHGRAREGERPIPGWLRRALLRGMALRPEDRPPDMETLLHRLERAPVRRRIAVLSGIAIVGLGTAASLMIASPEPSDPVCEDGEQQIATAYDPDDRSRIASALTSTELAMGPEMATRVTARLDDLAARWATVHRETCEATLIRKERSQASFDETLSCLTEVRQQVDRRVGMLRDADEDRTRRALELLDSIAAPEDCARASTLARRRSLEPPAEQREVVSRLEQRRDRLIARQAVERSFPELELSWTELLEDAEAVGHAPLLATIAADRANVRRYLGRHADGEADYSRSFASAVGCGDVVLASEVAVRIAYGFEHEGDVAEVERWLNLASTLAEHAQLPPVRSIELEISRAELLHFATDTPRAVSIIEDQIARAQHELIEPERSGLLARAEMTLSRTLDQAGRAEASLAAAERSTALLREILGEHHPRHGNALEYQAAALLKMQRGAEALELLRTAREINEASGAPGTIQGRAIATMQTASALMLVGRPPEALAESEAAMELARREANPKVVGWTLERHCLLLERAGRLDAAADTCQESLEHARAFEGPQAEPSLVYALTRVGRVSLRRGELTQGRERLEEAWDLARRDPAASGPRMAFPAGDLAWALLLQGEDRARAESLAKTALEHMSPEAFGRERADLVDRLRDGGLTVP